jgi:hypothetical protein
MSINIDDLRKEVMWITEVLQLIESSTYNYTNLYERCPDKYEHYIDYARYDDVSSLLYHRKKIKSRIVENVGD